MAEPSRTPWTRTWIKNAHDSQPFVGYARQPVRRGQIAPRSGSTGRSTRPHLHYATRVDDDPVDPQKYLRAGVRLGAYQS